MAKKGTAIIAKSNQLIEARTKLSIGEQRLIFFLLAQIKPTDQEFKEYDVSLKELSTFLGKSKSTVYEPIKQLTRDLLRRILTINEEDGPLQTAWLASAKYREGEGVVSLAFSPRLRPYLLNLKSCFTQFELNEVISFKNQYSWRIYELCKQYLTFGKREISLIELRNLLDLEDGKYTLYHQIKQRIITPTTSEINKKTCINIKFAEIRTGRKVTGILFEFSKKQDCVQQESLFARGGADPNCPECKGSGKIRFVSNLTGESSFQTCKCVRR